ncbi:MAG: O-antigen ligase family protein, partial [Olleya sp.]
HKVIVVFSIVVLLIIGAPIILNVTKGGNKVIDTAISGKINYVFNFLGNSNGLLKENSIDKRALINDCSKTLFLERPIFGYGLGEQHIHLTGCYAQKKEFLLVEGNYNTHNHYYFLLLSGGIIVLIPFIYLLLYFLKIALISNNNLLILFLILIISNLLVENILTRVNGILFFSLFLPLLYRYSIQNIKAN